MPKRRTISLTLALIIAAGATAPRVALGNRVLYEQPAASATAQPSPSPADTADDTQRQKRKEGGFASALAAPFRALARLFGGGKKKTDVAKKSAPRPAPNDAATQAEVNNQAQSTNAASASAAATPDAGKRAAVAPAAITPAGTTTDSAAPPREAQEVTRPSAASQEAGALASGVVSGAPPSTSSSEGVRVVRPSENGEAEKPKMWIPLIVGVPADPLSQGRALLEHGYLQEAIAELSIAASTVGPNIIEANNLLGLAYDRQGQHRLAAECYERALTAAPKDPIVLANLGYSLYLSDDYEGALKNLKLAAKLAPGTPVIYNNLGVVHARLGHDRDAFRYFALATNDYDAHIKLAGILEDQKRDRDAIKHYEAALRLQPGASAVLERLVALYERTGERDKADTARRALAQPKNPQKTTTGGGGG